MFGGFGQNNNNNQQQQSTGFGGFGSTTNNNAGFGQQQQQTSAFGSTANTGGGLFGGGGSGFGSASTPFGGNKPAFGSTATTSGGGLFGSTTATSSNTGFGGFGGNTNTTPSFGGLTSSGLFGGNSNTAKPAFGGASTGGIFGSTNTNSSFGQPNSNPFGSAQTANTECQGTGGTPFQTVTEKDGPNQTNTNNYQTITFMQPYQKFSLEELRLADYLQGRQYGNTNGQAGSFGNSTGFGGFGSNTQSNSTFGGNTTGNSLFGQAATSASPFGSTTQTAGAFGSNTGTGLFGAKPASSGLFGSTATPAQPSGSLFGSTNTNTGFGANANTGFGQTANPPSNTLFGSTQPAKTGLFGGTTSNTGFGSNPNSNTGGLFGSTGSTTTGTSNPFGGGQQPQQQQQNTSLFGQTNAKPAFGSFGSGGTQQAGGLFGNTTATSNNAGGGLFGNTQNNQQPTSNLFGNTNTNTQGSSLFGAPKPATTSLFGASNNTGGGGLFGNNNQQQQQQQQQQQNQTGGLFGNVNNQQSKPGGLFGNTGGSLFGGINNSQQQQTGSLFGGNNNNNQNQQANTGSLFGSTQNNPLQPPNVMTASVLDPLPYGSTSIFNGLPPPPQASPGPIATPISSGYKTRKPATLPQYKINPAMASRLVTPQKRGGYGFTYSTYGTPSSASSTISTPGGYGIGLLGSSIGRGLGKSFSTSNLRRNFDSDGESILTPGAFSAGSSRYSHAGSMKRLTIDRSLRTDLFSSPAVAALPAPEKPDTTRQPSTLKKRVSFDSSTMGGNSEQNSAAENNQDKANGVVSNHATPSAVEQGFLRSSTRQTPRANGTSSSSQQPQPEMEQVRGNELAIVQEEGSPEAPVAQPRINLDHSDPKPGRYYMEPSREQLRKMSREELKRVENFTLGREYCGHVVFNEPVDVTSIDLDNIFDNICIITLRSLTVYPDQSKKPPLGKGLNVPATISLENSWPRSRDRRTPTYEKSGPRFQKHVDRLMKVADTEFVRYDKENGVWVFKVPHFTTYGLDYDEDESEADIMGSSVLSDAPPTPTPKTMKDRGSSKSQPSEESMVVDSSIISEEQSHVSSRMDDDTFEFKKKRALPGAFDDMPDFEDDDDAMETESLQDQSFLGDRSAGVQSDEDDEPSEMHAVQQEDPATNSSLVIRDEDEEMVGAFPDPESPTNELFTSNAVGQFGDYGTPTKQPFEITDDWAEQLQRTISPRKQDRSALRASQAVFFKDLDDDEETPNSGAVMRPTTEIVTSIDLMNSLFGQEQARKSVKNKPSANGFKWPYSKQTQIEESELPEIEQQFHASFKPHWKNDSSLVFAPMAKLGRSSSSNQLVSTGKHEAVRSGDREVQILDIAQARGLTNVTFEKQKSIAVIVTEKGVPRATMDYDSFKQFAPTTQEAEDVERAVWNLADILFGNYSDPIANIMPDDQRTLYQDRMRKDALCEFWAQLCQEDGLQAVAAAPNAEERALAYLTINKIEEACEALVEAKDYRLATLVAQLPGDQASQAEMAAQIDEWRSLNVLSEMTEPIRALYDILAGSVCKCEGKKGVVEDQAKSFSFSERFELDWRRAFGLRLYYAIHADQPIELAVKKFQNDLEKDEPAKPRPPFALKVASASPNEDILWGMMQLYASERTSQSKLDLATIVMPQNITSESTLGRITFELYHALVPRFPDFADAARADQITMSFTAELEAAEQWKWALLAALFLSLPQQRRQVVQLILTKNASKIDEHDNELMKLLFDDYVLPPAWVWEAKALYARAVLQDHYQEVDYLQRAENWAEAHETLCRDVAPYAVIEEDFDTLLRLLRQFDVRKVAKWDRGGQVYEDYAKLMTGLEGKEKTTAIRRLLAALPSTMPKKGPLLFVQMVAFQEMSMKVSSLVVGHEEYAEDKARVLALPASAENTAKVSSKLSLKYYKSIMSQG